jgi:hypothetical protein
MAEISTLFMGAQLGKEVTPGTSVAASKKMLSFGIKPGMQTEFKRTRAEGSKFETLATLEKEWTQASISGQPDYNELAYLFAGIFKVVTPTGAGTAKTWVFDMANNGPDTVQTYTTEYGSSVRAYKFTYGILSALGLEFSRSGGSLSGSMLGQAIQDGVALTAGPTSAEQAPISSTHVSIYLADTAAGLDGATALARVSSTAFNISNRRSAAWFLNRANASKWVDSETVPAMTTKFVAEADAEGMGLLTTLRANSKKFIRLEAQGPLISGADYYKLTLDMPGRVSAVDEFSDVDGIYSIGWTLAANFDSTFTAAVKATLVNTLAAL